MISAAAFGSCKSTSNHLGLIYNIQSVKKKVFPVDFVLGGFGRHIITIFLLNAMGTAIYET